MGIVGRALAKLRRDGLAATLATGIAATQAALDFRRRAAYRQMLEQSSLGERFSAIYADNLWSSPESGSGLGSEVEFTANLRQWLVTTLPRLGVRSIVDAPCGDFNWMRLVVPQLELDYLGLDIVDSVIAANTKCHSSAQVRFAVANICSDPIPACDLLMVRDCLFHLSYADIDRFLANAAHSEFKYLLTTTHLTRPDFANADIVSGDFRLIDLFKPPFGFTPANVIEAVDDYPPGFPAPRQMVLIAKRDVPTGLAL